MNFMRITIRCMSAFFTSSQHLLKCMSYCFYGIAVTDARIGWNFRRLWCNKGSFSRLLSSRRGRSLRSHSHVPLYRLEPNHWSTSPYNPFCLFERSWNEPEPQRSIGLWVKPKREWRMSNAIGLRRHTEMRNFLANEYWRVLLAYETRQRAKRN